MKWLKAWWLWAALLIVAGVVAGWALPPPPLPKRAPRAEHWQLPAALQADAATSALIPANVKFEGDGGSTGPQGPWRLAGIASGPVALVQILQTKEVVRVRLGQELPNGGVLAWVDSGEAGVELDGCVKVYNFYSPEPVRQSGEKCPKVEEPAKATAGAAGARPVSGSAAPVAAPPPAPAPEAAPAGTPSNIRRTNPDPVSPESKPNRARN